MCLRGMQHHSYTFHYFIFENAKIHTSTYQSHSPNPCDEIFIMTEQIFNSPEIKEKI